MRYVLLGILLAFAANAGAWNGYDPKVRAAFVKAHPCPGGRDQGSTRRCRGYVTDHIIPLCAQGSDTVDNLQWQKRAASLSKDRREAAYCACIKKKGKDACTFTP